MAIIKSSNSLLEDQHLKQVRRYFNLFWQDTEVRYVR
ncbi:hypothetical protein PEC301619_13450 [Pectobacterium carotovorum subsp. carotovorum]|nr:hypothetical protein PEC301619_13450 [Pectobacterium carotovorum subsp. carotovorum]